MSYQEQAPSGIPVRAVYGPGDRSAHEPAPGQFPFTRGNFATGYRGRLWTFRQYSGFGTAEESNRRYRYLLDQGGTGLSVALDRSTAPPRSCSRSTSPPRKARPATQRPHRHHPERHTEGVRVQGHLDLAVRA